MSDIPPALTPERVDAMLSGLAEICYAGAVEAGARLKAAEGAEAFERATRALQCVSRNLRQTLAMKQRFDRRQARMAQEARQLATQAALSAGAHARAERLAAFGHFCKSSNRLADLVWTEYEGDDAQEVYEQVTEYLTDISDEDPEAFVNIPIDDLVARVAQAFGLGETRSEAEPEVEPEPAPQPEPVFEADPEPPPRPPDPPDPPPYIPPWEKLKPGQIFPGGSGW